MRGEESKALLSTLLSIAGVCLFLLLPLHAQLDVDNLRLGTNTTFRSATAADNFATNHDATATDPWVHRSETNGLGGSGTVVSVVSTNLQADAPVTAGYTNIISLTTTISNGTVVVHYGAQYDDNNAGGISPIGIRLVDESTNELSAVGWDTGTAPQDMHLSHTYHGTLSGSAKTYSLQGIAIGSTNGQRWKSINTGVTDDTNVHLHNGTSIIIEQFPQ